MATQVTTKRISPAGRGVTPCRGETSCRGEAAKRSRVVKPECEAGQRSEYQRSRGQINQNNLIMQNKAKSPDERMNASDFLTAGYKNSCLPEHPQNKAKTNPKQSQTNPNKADFHPKQTQTNPNQTQFQTTCVQMYHFLMPEITAGQ